MAGRDDPASPDTDRDQGRQCPQWQAGRAREGVIRGYRAEIDRRGVGLGLTVFVELKVGQHSRANADALSQALAAMPEVVACHMVSGGADFLAELVIPDLEAYERLLSEKLLTLPMVTDVRSNFALRTIKTGGPLAFGPAAAPDDAGAKP